MRFPHAQGLFALSVAFLLLSSGPAPQAAAAPEETRVVARSLDEARILGTLLGLDAQHLTLAAAADAPRKLPIAETIEVSLPARPVTRGKGAWVRLTLTGGGSLVARITGGAQDILRVDSPSLGAVELLLDQILSLEALPATDDPCHDLAARYPRADEGDVAYDVDGDEYRGAALEVNDEGLVIETAGNRERTIPWTRLRVMHLENPPLPPHDGLHAEVELQDGSRLKTLAPPVLEGTTLGFTLRCQPGKARTVPLAAVHHLRWYGGRFDYASQLPHQSTFEMPYDEPDSELAESFYERLWSARVDRRPWSGCPLRMGGRTFRHGFGVQSKSTITIPLDGRYASFRTWFGIDDEVLDKKGAADLKGLVDARVRGDGKVLWEAKRVAEGEKPREIGPLDVTGVKVLVLEVGFGDAVPLSRTFDRADWGEPILVKTAE